MPKHKGMPQAENAEAGASSGQGERTPHFAELLRYYRENYGERIGGGGPGQPRIQLTASALLECMRERGYSLSSGSYSLIESGDALPRDAAKFITTVSQCLTLSKKEQESLVHQFAYDYLRSKLGEDLVNKVLKPL